MGEGSDTDTMINLGTQLCCIFTLNHHLPFQFKFGPGTGMCFPPSQYKATTVYSPSLSHLIKGMNPLTKTNPSANPEWVFSPNLHSMDGDYSTPLAGSAADPFPWHWIPPLSYCRWGWVLRIPLPPLNAILSPTTSSTICLFVFVSISVVPIFPLEC